MKRPAHTATGINLNFHYGRASEAHEEGRVANAKVPRRKRNAGGNEGRKSAKKARAEGKISSLGPVSSPILHLGIYVHMYIYARGGRVLTFCGCRSRATV